MGAGRVQEAEVTELLAPAGPDPPWMPDSLPPRPPTGSHHHPHLGTAETACPLLQSFQVAPGTLGTPSFLHYIPAWREGEAGPQLPGLKEASQNRSCS